MRAIVVSWRYTPDMARNCRNYPKLTPTAVEAALRYYETHRDEIDCYIRENDTDGD